MLVYKGPLACGLKTTRALFTVSMKSPEEAETPVVVRFTRRYFPEAHKLLAGVSLAPRLIHHEYATGVHFVVTEHSKGWRLPVM